MLKKRAFRRSDLRKYKEQRNKVLLESVAVGNLVNINKVQYIIIIRSI